MNTFLAFFLLYPMLARSSTVSVEYENAHSSGGKTYFHGKCTVTLPSFQPAGNWRMRITLNKGTTGFQIWDMETTTSEQNGKVYNTQSKYDKSGTETIRFQLNYIGSTSDYPTGTCENAFNGQPISGTTVQPAPSTTNATTTTTTPVPITTTIVSSTTTTTTGSINSVPVGYSTSYQSNGQTYFHGKCDVTLPGPQPTLQWNLRITFNKETTHFVIWTFYVNSTAQNGRIYNMRNKNSISGDQSIAFMLNYVGSVSDYPTGVCESAFNGQPLGGTTTSGQSTTTASPAATSTTSSTTPPTTTTTPTTTPATTTRATTTSANTASTTTANVNTKYNYRELLNKSILFFEAQRSGDLPPTNRIPYRGDSSLNDSGAAGEDLSGGWHDAGDHVKFNFPMASSTTLLALSLYRYADAYSDAGVLSDMYDSIKWPLDYFIKCWRDTAKRYYATVANPYTDHSYWIRPEDMTMYRPAYQVNPSSPGSDVAAETAAAMAAGALAFANFNAAYSNTLRQKAESLYSFAKTYRGKYSDSIPIVNEFYSSGDDKDELCLSAALLYMLTGNTQYRSDAISYHPDYTAWSLSWDEKTVLCQMLLINITPGTSTYKSRVNDFLNNYINGQDPPRTQCGLSYRLQWGSLRYAANAAYIALLAADSGVFTQSQANQFKTYAMSQIHYALGDNKYDRSYVVGFGNNPPVRPHHRAASCPISGSCGFSFLDTPNPNPNELTGALVGGPDSNDNYTDVRSNYERNEVACDYNAGFQSAIAALHSFAIRGQLPTAPSKPQTCQ